MLYERTTSIDPEHPALAGHFPGNPVVPAVVILEHVLEALRTSILTPIQVVAIPHAKFISPLQPGEALTIKLESEEEGEATFTCSVDSRLISTGFLRFTLLPEAIGHE